MCRPRSECLQRLSEAARTLLGELPAGGGWAAYAGPPPPPAAPDGAAALRRAARCMELLQQLLEQCQARPPP
jgi:hypothetical protein